jgi:hypothetical protein
MILQYLDLSTGHVKQETMHTLQKLATPYWFDSSWPAMTIAGYDCGVFVTVPPLNEPDVAKQAENLPPELANVLWGAFRVGAALIRFDADGEIDPTLPYFEW